MRFRIIISLMTLAFILPAGLLVDPALAGACEYTDIELSADCTKSVGGGGNAPPVTCEAGTDGCQQRCDVIIPDDSIFPDGVHWDGDPDVLPAGSGSASSEPTDAVAAANRPLLSSDLPSGNWSETGTWLACIEGDLSNDDILTRNYKFGPAGPLIDVWSLLIAAAARATPPLPPIQRAPADASVAQMPTWFWVDPPYWHTYIGEGTSPTGRMTVRVVATPQDVTWTTPEETLVCDQGVPWTGAEDPREGSDCITIFKHAYSYYGGPVTVTGAARFSAVWSMIFDNGSELEQGVFEPYIQTSAFDIEIHEVQALVVSEPGQSDDVTDFTNAEPPTTDS